MTMLAVVFVGASMVFVSTVLISAYGIFLLIKNATVQN